MKHALNNPILNLSGPILALPRFAKRIVVLTVDMCLCVLTLWLAYYLRLGEFINLSGNSLIAAGASIAISLPIFVVLGLYRAIFRYSGWPALLVVTRAIVIYGLIYATMFTAIGIPDVPRTIGIIQPILLLLFIGGSRALARLWLGDQYQYILKRASIPKAMIYGAGIAGRQLASVMTNSHEMQVVGFLDDDDRLHGHVLNGLPIYNPSELQTIISNIGISVVLLAMTKISRTRRNEILNSVQNAHISVRTLPSMSDLVEGKINFSDLRELDVDDLLGRDPVAPNQILLAKNISNKIVLITGAGGSIGSELCRQIIYLRPKKLLLVEQSEFALYTIHQELISKLIDAEISIVPLLASVQSYDRMSEIISTWLPDTIYHAAAYKHVPLVEHNPAEGIKNNVFGTLNTALAASEHRITNFILVSTDKAVRPTNIMGASKRLAEMILQALNECPTQTIYSMVRFGNVLGSSGSVIPKFRQQIRDSGPITITHLEITRYFMTIPEAAQLVIQAGAMAKGGDVFVLDMGEPVKIFELARRMIDLSGLKVKDENNEDGDIEIKIIGLRPGEKLYEELLIGNNPKTTPHPRIMKASEDFIMWGELQTELKSLENALNENDVTEIRCIMQKLVTGYVPSDEIVDLIYMELDAQFEHVS
jgi:FlaA1/EpsC-like NDP-sugar epimerase